MSMTALRVAFQHVRTKNLSPSATIVLLCLANRHNQETGRCDPSISRLTEDSGLSRRSVQNGLRELEKLKVIQTVFRKRTTGRGRADMNSRYRISGGANSAPTPAQNLRTKQEDRRASAFDDLAMIIEDSGHV